MEMFAPGSTGHRELDREAPSALHVQISDAMRATIASGDWASGHRLKTEPELASELGVSRGTLRRALATLIEQGLLKQVRGKGTFITENLLEPAVAQKLSTLSEDFASQGLVLGTEVISAGIVKPPPIMAMLLGISGGRDAFRLVRRRLTDGAPIALVHNYVRSDLAPGIEDIDFCQTTLFGALEGQYGLKIGTARRTFSAVSATTDIAEALGVPAGSPVQYLEQLTFLADGRAIEYSDVWINSSALRVTTFLSRR